MRNVEPGHHDEPDLLDQAALLAVLAQSVRRLNTLPAGQWSGEDLADLASLVEELMEAAEREAELAHKGNPYEKQNALNQARMRLRMLLQTLQPPAEMQEALTRLWDSLRLTDLSAVSTFARKTLMNSKVRQDVMNRQIEESVDEADDLAAKRRVQAISRDGGRRQGAESEADERHEGDPARDSSASSAGGHPRPGATQDAAARPPTLKYLLRTLKKKRRDIGKNDAEQVAALAFDTMRVLRDEIAPRWAPETQPWMLNTADNHIFQSVLGVIPEALFKETNAYDGIQNLRSGEHAFGLRAAERIVDGAAKKSSS